jgi:hypothetical protein
MPRDFIWNELLPCEILEKKKNACVSRLCILDDGFLEKMSCLIYNYKKQN